MTKYLLEESGDFRRGEEGVFSGSQCIFMAPPARLVPQLMEDLFNWMKKAQNHVHPLILSSIFHYEFVFIHPFSDGNGRMARLWHTAILSKWKSIFEYIPLESQVETFQDEYYQAIARCHKDGASTIFIEFMLSQIDQLLDHISVQISEENEALFHTLIKRNRQIIIGRRAEFPGVVACFFLQPVQLILQRIFMKMQPFSGLVDGAVALVQNS